MLVKLLHKFYNMGKGGLGMSQDKDQDKALQVLSDPGVAHAMAVANSRIEGVDPDPLSVAQVNQVVEGELTADELRASWIAEIKALP